jgi:superfamily I DNA and/or RNA helicase
MVYELHALGHTGMMMSVGVISPYKGQVELIIEMIETGSKKTVALQKRVTINSVDGFQVRAFFVV